MNSAQLHDQSPFVGADSPAPEIANEFESLLRRVRSGDATAIEMLVEQYRRAVLRAVRARLGRPMRNLLDSMDIVQSVHRSLLIGLRQDKFQFQSPDQLIALAALMVRRKVARHWRRLKHAPGQSSAVSDRSGSSTKSAVLSISVDQVAAGDPSPSMVLASQELLATLLSKVNEFDQQLVHLKLAGQSTSETARQLGRDPAFVRMRWSRLRQTLRESGCLS